MPTRADQTHAWIVFEIKTNLFVAFFFNEELAMRYIKNAKQPMRMELWKFSHEIIESGYSL